MNIVTKIAGLQKQIDDLKKNVEKLMELASPALNVEQAVPIDKTVKESITSLSNIFDSMINTGKKGEAKEKANDIDKIPAHQKPFGPDAFEADKGVVVEEDPDVIIDEDEEQFGGKDIDDENVVIDGESIPINEQQEEDDGLPD